LLLNPQRTFETFPQVFQPLEICTINRCSLEYSIDFNNLSLAAVAIVSVYSLVYDLHFLSNH